MAPPSTTAASHADWPSDRVDAAEVRRWISAVLPGAPVVVGPTIVHRSNAWGVTSRFVAGGRDVVHKASFLPLSFAGADVYALVQRSASRLVPTIVAATERPSHRWMLFDVFDGPTVGSLADLEAVAQVARTMASIQAAVAASGDVASSTLPRVGAGDIPAMLDSLLDGLRDRLADGRAEQVAGDPGEALTPDDVGRLAAARPRLVSWAKEAAGWPDSILHVDLHPDNAARLADGRTLIFDWEEGCVGYPFLVLDKLLIAAEERWGDAGAAAVRAAYLDGLPWRSRVERERALDLGLLLSPLWFASADVAFAAAMGWDPTDRITSWLNLALRRWNADPPSPSV